MSSSPSSITSPLAQDSLIANVVEIAEKAGEILLKYYQTTSELDIQRKADHSPVTAADLHAHNFIAEELKKLGEGWPILSEEAIDTQLVSQLNDQPYWLIDPMDGTKEFIARTDEFTVNIALIENGRPLLGVVTAPALDQGFYANAALGAWQFGSEGHRKIKTHQPHRGAEKLNPVVAISRSHPNPSLQEFLQDLPWDCQIITMGSSLKLCHVACGKVDLYPRIGPTSLWDIAAAECIVHHAGGHTYDLNNQPLYYRPKQGLLNPYFVVVGDPNMLAKELLKKYRLIENGKR